MSLSGHCQLLAPDAIFSFNFLHRSCWFRFKLLKCVQFQQPESTTRTTTMTNKTNKQMALRFVDFIIPAYT